MDTITWEDARRELDLLRLPEVVRTAFEDPARVPEVLKCVMRDPGELFEEPTDHGFYPPGAITPLWADHTGHILVGHRREGGAPGFLRFLLEEQQLLEEGLTFHQVVVRELVAVWEDATDDAEAEAHVREAAQHLAFPATDRLVEALYASSRNTWAEHDAFLAAFRATLR